MLRLLKGTASLTSPSVAVQSRRALHLVRPPSSFYWDAAPESVIVSWIVLKFLFFRIERGPRDPFSELRTPMADGASIAAQRSLGVRGRPEIWAQCGLTDRSWKKLRKR